MTGWFNRGEVIVGEVTIEKKLFKPAVGMESLVGIMNDNYPLSFGNYCSISGGPYLVNMWSENLREWSRRNPDVSEIEVTVVTHCGKSIGFVSDERMRDWRNQELCVTGNGWPTAEVCRTVCGLLGTDSSVWLCGCESSDQAPSQSLVFEFRGTTIRHFCQLCHRSWETYRHQA